MLSPAFSIRRAFPGLLVIAVVGCAPAARAKGTNAPRPPLPPPAVETPAQPEPEADGELPPLPPPDEVPVPMTPGVASTAPPAARYASLDRAQCEAELGRRKIGFDRVDEARGVVAPLRLKGLEGGIDFHSMLPPAQRKTSPYEIYDCRLVLAIDDWAKILTRHDVVEVIHFSVYRPPPAKQVLTGPGSRHPGGLAIDAAIFKTKDGKTLSVEKDFHGHIGSKPCGQPTKGLPPESVTLRELVCEAASQQLFNVVLTPDFNWPHRNHFHLEVSASAKWVYVR